MFKVFRKNLRLASDSAAKVKRLGEIASKLSDKSRVQGEKIKAMQAAAAQNAQELAQITRSTENLQMLCGRIAVNQIASLPPGTPFEKVEFKVFSQWGEDGIIQHLIQHLKLTNRSFVEFGVETYVEANTRFLLANDNWRGLVIDGSEDNIRTLQQTEFYWKYDLTAVASFITPSNINELLRRNKFSPRVGILSVDIDGMDYWVLQAVTIQADILICEYNSIFGPSALVTVPPDDAFQRTQAHHSNLFYGMSLAAAASLAKSKGYDLVGVNSAGNNAFFINQDLDSPFQPVTPEQCYVAAKFRESRGTDGGLTFLDFKDRQNEISDCAAYDLSANRVRPLREML